MTTEVYINGLLIDIDEESTVTATYGNVTFGELSKRKGVKSNTWNAPFSQRNKLALEGCEIVSSASQIPYRKNLIRVDIAGVTVFEGFCSVSEASDKYEIQSYAGASDFYSIISNTKLSSLNLSAYSHVWGETNIKNSWTNVEGYIYAYVGYGKEAFVSPSGYPDQTIIPPDHLLPQIYFHTVIKAIATDAGYTLSGDVLTDDRFLKQVIIANKFPTPINYGGTFNLSLLLPDLMQSKVWLDFANMYGQMFDIDDATKEIRCHFIDDLLFNDPEDWTGKVDKTDNKKTKFQLDSYGQSSFLRFKSDPDTDANGCSQDYAKQVLIDDETLDPEADIYKSDFYLVQDRNYPGSPSFPHSKTFNIKNGIYYGIWDPAYNYFDSNIYVWRNGTYYVSTGPSINKIPGIDTAFWTPKQEKDIWEVKSRPMYGTLYIDISSPMKVSFSSLVDVTRIIFANGLDWPTSYQRHYRVFDRIIEKTKVVDELIKLNYSDINQISFERLKTIDGELYVLEEVTQFKLNKPDSTICKFIRL